MEMGIILAVIGAALAVGIPGVGSILAISAAGQAGAGVVSEDPEKFGKVLLLEALPGSQGIYGFLGAVMILQKIGLLGGELATLTTSLGWELFLASIPIVVTGFMSAVWQGKISVAGMNIVAKKPEASGKAVVLSVMAETYAILGLLTTILIINGIQLS